jgi:hypothetical protein
MEGEMPRIRYWLAIVVIGVAVAFTINAATTRSSSIEEVAAAFRLEVDLPTAVSR